MSNIRSSHTISIFSGISIPGIDRSLVVALSKVRRSNLTIFMKIMSKIGDGYVWGIICIMATLINLHIGLTMMCASVLQVVIQQIVKHIFIRQRPFIAHDDIFYIIPPPDKFSFPSGHTAGAFVMVFMAFHFFPILFGAFLIIACLIAISRVYLGLHYPTDLLGGVALGYISYKLGLLLLTAFSPISVS